MNIPAHTPDMKTLALSLVATAVLGNLSPLFSEDAASVINLNKPVSESLKPDGFYWSFDDGLIGESEPKMIEDHSGNGFAGQVARGSASALPTYTEGVFGTGIFVEGFADVSWRKGTQYDNAQDPDRLTMKGQPFTGGVWYKMDNLKPVNHILIRRDENAVGWRLQLMKAEESDPDTDGSAWFLNLEYGDSRIRSRSQVPTSTFADKKWHHVGFSVTPEDEEGRFTVEYWLDGQPFDTVTFTAKIPNPDPEKRFLSVGTGTWGSLDDAFVTTGTHTFKK